MVNRSIHEPRLVLSLQDYLMDRFVLGMGAVPRRMSSVALLFHSDIAWNLANAVFCSQEPQ